MAVTSEPAHIQAGDHNQDSSLRVTDLARRDVMLGDPWLRERNPRMSWKTRRMLFGSKNGPVMLKPIDEPEPDFLLWAKQLSRIAKREKACIFAIAAQHPDSTKNSDSAIPDCIQGVLDDFKRMRKEKLPPGQRKSSKRDHYIRLKEGATPATRPICKAPQSELKELREQLTELLEKGLIAPSKSPLGSADLAYP